MFKSVGIRCELGGPILRKRIDLILHSLAFWPLSHRLVCLPCLDRKSYLSYQRKSVAEANQVGEGYKSISKELGLHLSTDRFQMEHHCYSPQQWLPDKSNSKSKVYVIRGSNSKSKVCVIRGSHKEPYRVTCKDLQASLALVNVSAHPSTIRQTMDENQECVGEDGEEGATALQEEHCLGFKVCEKQLG